jgi:DNA-binding CsgD family transcriptional regulator
MPERYGNRALNNTEGRVVELVAQRLKNNEVAEVMGTTRYVIANYLRAIYDKLGLWNRVELALWYESRKRHEQTMN